MASKKLILILTFLSIACAVFAQTNKKVRLSPILQIWNTENQELELLFNIVNETDKPVDLSYTVQFISLYGKGKKNQPQVLLEAGRTQLIKISYKLSAMQIGNFINTSIKLYGPDFKEFKSQAVKYFEITAIENLAGGKIKLDYSEELPMKRPGQITNDLKTGILAKQPDSGEPSSPEGDPSIRKGPKKIYLEILSFQARRVGTRDLITVTLSEPPVQKSVTSESFFLMATSGKRKNRKLGGRLVIKDTKITLIPTIKLDPSIAYRVIFSNQIRSKAGHTLKNSRALNIRTKKIPPAKLFGSAKQYLKVQNVSPRVKSSNILTDTKISLRLSGIIDPKSVTNQSFFLSWKGGKIEGDLNTTKNQIIMTPKKPLEYGVVYTVIATANIKDQTGKSLKNSIKWQFKTRKDIQYPESEDPNILIFSPSHEPVSYVKEKKGSLKIGITAFSNILHADVNGREIPITKDTQIEFNIPYTLRKRATSFEITTFTSEGKARKKYIINYGNKPKPKKPPFQLISILSTAQVDNLNNDPVDSTELVSADKAVLTLVPQYELKIGKQSILRFKGILLRERYANEEHQSRETSYSQAAIEWEERKTFLGTLTAGVGWNFIRLNNSHFIGENEISEETFFSSEVKNRISKTTNWKVGLAYKNKDASADAAVIDNETDSSEITLNSTLDFKLGRVKNKAKISYAVNDAVGKYQDYTNASANYTLSAPIGNFTPSLGYKSVRKQMKIFNPAEEATPEYSSASISAKVKYKLFPRTSFALAYKRKNQVSNLEKSTYTANTVTLSYIQIF